VERKEMKRMEQKRRGNEGRGRKKKREEGEVRKDMRKDK
jgi:hypothetical protein